MTRKTLTRKTLAWIGAVAILVSVFTFGFATSAYAIDPWYGTCPTTICSNLTGYQFSQYCYRWPDNLFFRCEVWVHQTSYARCFTYCDYY